MTTMKAAATPRHRPSIWKPFKLDVGSDMSAKFRKNSRTHVTIGQALTLAALSAAGAAVLTALIAVYCLSNSVPDIYSDHLVASTTSGAISHHSLLRTAESQLVELVYEKEATVYDDSDETRLEVSPMNMKEASYVMLPNTLPDRYLEDDGVRPHIAWLMSFPNSGTSFTLHMTREATNCTTATNYALEGEIKDKPSVPAIPGPKGEQGPWLELIPDRFTKVPEMILTKTHCKGFCSGRSCGPEKTVHTVRSFMTGCLTGTRGIETDDGMQKVTVTYKPERVKKAIHVFRHPLDNIVARFHLEYNVQGAKGNSDFTKLFPKNSTGFNRWCSLDNLNRDLLESRFIDRGLRDSMKQVTCFNEFYRYVQWHNLAFSTSHDMAIPTMILHYHEYSDDFENTRDRILEFLELTRVGEGIEFHSGKEYRNYYSRQQKQAIYTFLEEFASAETWGQLKDYDFEE